MDETSSNDEDPEKSKDSEKSKDVENPNKLTTTTPTNSTKFNSLEKIRTFIQTYCKKTITPKDPIGFSYFKQLLSQHPTWKDKVDTIHRFRVIKSKLNDSCILQIECDWSDKFFTVSWKKCHIKRTRKTISPHEHTQLLPSTTSMISPNDLQLFNSSEELISSSISQTKQSQITQKTSVDKLTCAMRYAIRRQIMNWKRQNTINQSCKTCKSTSILQCDHIEPFVVLKTRFIKECKLNEIPIPETFDYSFKTCQSRFKRKDKSFKTKWQYYHLKHASFQWLCKTCNLKKGKK
jgi:hypothetical protein